MLFFVVITLLITAFTDILYPKSQNSNKNLLFFLILLFFAEKQRCYPINAVFIKKNRTKIRSDFIDLYGYMWYYRYMLAFERKEIIKAEILQSGSILVSEMSKKLDCSEETIRRDLKDLETDGKIKRIHGGAYLSSLDDRGLPIRIRQTLLLKEKQDIADYAFSHFISENDTIMLDSSTTCVTFAKKLFDADMPVTIITNSLLIFSAYNEYPSLETKLIGIGGNYRKRACSFVGYEATDSVSHYLADKCFISSSAVDAQHGLVDNSSNECQVRKMFIKQSRLHYLLADHTKFSDSADYIIADLASLNAVVADVPLPNEWEQILQSHNIDVHYCRK